MILGTEEILNRLNNCEIFHKGTWNDGSIKEASYALRVANDGMVIDGVIFPPGKKYGEPLIVIQPGRIAILSTEERLCMPGDLVGKLGVRLEFASKGLTGLMGIQVDPYYGSNQANERLYIKVANFGNEPVRIRAGSEVFNIEFSEVVGAQNPRKGDTWERIIESLSNQSHIDWSYMTRVETNTEGIKGNVLEQINSIRDNQQSVVMFGVILVSITILGALITFILNVEGAPNWVADWGWIILVFLCAVAVIAIVAFTAIASLALFPKLLKVIRLDWPQTRRKCPRCGRPHP